MYEGLLNLANCKMMPGARALIEHLHKHKIPMAICTSSDSKEFPKKIGDCKDLVEKVRLRDVIGEDNLKMFNFQMNPIVLAGDDPEVKKGKPAADPYLV
jgi:beta-phosphoglucomutase-like phosphatase (HAD superfamily)